MPGKLMKCGHVAQGTTFIKGQKVDVCVICSSTTEDAYIVVEENKKPSLEGRKSKCSQCGKITDSKYTLPFFEYRKDAKYDLHYDGCYGWS